MESAVLCTKKRTALSASEGVSCHVTHFTTTDLGSETSYYSNISSGNNPIKHTDPDGRITMAQHYADPKKNPIGHLFNDISPYWIWGNSLDDPTPLWARITGTYRSPITKPEVESQPVSGGE
jgi:hypothetical protein